MKQKPITKSFFGDPDFFDDRHKRKLLRLAEIKSTDVFYDLGCGYGTILILAVKEFGVKKAIGYEFRPKRAKVAKQLVEKENLSDNVEIRIKKMLDADIYNADVIFAMHMQYEDDFKKLWNQHLRRGTRVIKHDLPLLGYIPHRVDIPFYRMDFPFKKAKTQNQWASYVLQKKDTKIQEVWHELYYHQMEKVYSEYDIDRFKRILSKRVQN